MNVLQKWLVVICLLTMAHSTYAECVATYLVHRQNGVEVYRELLYVTCHNEPTLSSEDGGGGYSPSLSCNEDHELGSAHALPITCRLHGRVAGSLQMGNLHAKAFLRSSQLDFSSSSSTYYISCNAVEIVDDDSTVHTYKPAVTPNKMLVLADFFVVVEYTGISSEIINATTGGILTTGQRWIRKFDDEKFIMDCNCFNENE